LSLCLFFFLFLARFAKRIVRVVSVSAVMMRNRRDCACGEKLSLFVQKSLGSFEERSRLRECYDTAPTAKSIDFYRLCLSLSVSVCLYLYLSLSLSLSCKETIFVARLD
jgi:hypothetical protein